MTTDNQVKKLNELYANFRKAQMELDKCLRVTLAEHDLSLHTISENSGLPMANRYGWRKDYSGIFKLVEEELKKRKVK